MLDIRRVGQGSCQCLSLLDRDLASSSVVLDIRCVGLGSCQFFRLLDRMYFLPWCLYVSDVRAYPGLIELGCMRPGLARTIYLGIYGVYIRCLQQGNHHTYGHIWCRHTVLANPICVHQVFLLAPVQGQGIVRVLLKECINHRVGQNPMYTQYMTVCMVISLLKAPYVHRI